MKKKREKYAWLLLSTALITTGQVLGGGEQVVKASVEGQTNSVKKSKAAVEHSTTNTRRTARGLCRCDCPTRRSTSF